MSCRFTILIAIAFACWFLGCADTSAPATETVSIWPERAMPGTATTRPENDSLANGQVERITSVSVPTLAFYAAKVDGPAPVVVVCPGGGYEHLAYQKEGTEIAQWLNSIGMHAAVLKYRVPNNREGALQDLQRAIRLVRSRAKAWKVDPNRVGVIGFSAGGHLCARLSTRSQDATYQRIDQADDEKIRPDFTMLVYPAYLEKDGVLAPELKIPADMPPTLLIHAEDDLKYVNSSKVFHAALDAAHVSNELHLYPTGGHGHGLRSSAAVSVWPKVAREWLVTIHILKE